MKIFIIYSLLLLILQQNKKYFCLVSEYVEISMIEVLL